MKTNKSNNINFRIDEGTFKAIESDMKIKKIKSMSEYGRIALIQMTRKDNNQLHITKSDLPLFRQIKTYINIQTIKLNDLTTFIHQKELVGENISVKELSVKIIETLNSVKRCSDKINESIEQL